ncbi:tRNA (adenosine(37)-N6)-threonylcarbamoyltransferase complex dimerization subunit type 1 TsaB [Candidatus Viridilinea mediisalina]|uniref:tRNA (Adenosine(37)-N6)-threonylcarbamoyltransferase complex dimerization subunit type 1 TsaB n=1 Tax=Candidatus Viridilinea mediisalina TaxID=2024553 RepID=A0A2A6RFC4_9CHLR|nr:tRNA (adenosine(37)-N6)-threonylcarbamoyltransferase complex dimerization subunit type 1 TsaB [Candidatus Viridilinea mediisalina]PDW01586.1 tRNA (adenosine(37)-N6)-threonylcarbamoyltransferase complex dimerization subunit type 1 TsaB [Candidatus Viridilinea mediisalina]
MLLAIDTATALTGLALYNETGPHAECIWESGRNHTAQLLPQLDLLLHHAGVERTALRAVAVGLGPGSWSGLRVGLSLAKGLVLAGGLRLLGISTLEALVYQFGRPGMPIYPLIRLGRERFATAPFLPDPQSLGRQGPDRNVTLDELCAALNSPSMLCGDLDNTTLERLRRATNVTLHAPPPAAALRRPSFLAELAWQHLKTGRQDDVATLEPIYLGAAVKT